MEGQIYRVNLDALVTLRSSFSRQIICVAFHLYLRSIWLSLRRSRGTLCHYANDDKRRPLSFQRGWGMAAFLCETKFKADALAEISRC